MTPHVLLLLLLLLPAASAFPLPQAAMYYIAGSSQSYTSPAVGKPRDQKSCLTCVAHASTEAVEMAVASAMRISHVQLQRKGLTASPMSLYYCSPGGKLGRHVMALSCWDVDCHIVLLPNTQHFVFRGQLQDILYINTALCKDIPCVLA